MADVLILTASAVARERARRVVHAESAAGAAHVLRPAATWAELFALAAGASLGVALVDPYHGGAFAAAELRRLRERYPALEVVAYADFAGRPAGDAFTLALLGVRAVVAEGAPDEAALLRAALEESLNRAPLEALVEHLGEVVPAPVHRWLGPVLRSPREPRTVPELARRAGCSARTLRRTLAAAGLPTPEQLLAWRRLLHAARLLEDPGRSAEGVARALDFSSGAALRKSLKALTGLRPSEVAIPGGLARVAACFLDACRRDVAGRSAREPVAAAPRPPIDAVRSSWSSGCCSCPSAPGSATNR